MSADGIRTTCPYCGVGCGVIATRRADGSVSIAGDPEHPANKGRLCSKGSALAETIGLDGRLLTPRIGDRDASWDTALDLVAARFAATMAEHGPDSVALYVSGQILTEDYYAANKLVKGYFGTGNIDTNSRLCMASSVAGHRRAFGTDTVPGCYDDLEQADLVVLVGSNLAWCHPILFQRLAAAREARGTKVVVIDPRRTATCEIADHHLAIAPGSDVALFNGLLAALAERGALDRNYIDAHTTGFDAALATARETSLGEVARLTGLEPSSVAAFYALFASTERVVTVYSQGVNQSSAGTDKVNAIINCHLACGRIGKPGMGPFSVTGQPNAMGGREVGGLANMLAAHMDIENAHHRDIVQSYWGSPRIADRPGLKAVELFDAVADGRIKALWIMATNPVASLPDADRVRDAIAACPFVVVSEVEAATDTTRLAHVLLPALAWGEKDGTVTNSERRISRQRAFLPAPGEARADWWQIAEVARRMGYDGFAWASARDIFAEYAGLTGTANGGSRDLDISAHADITDAAFDALTPFQWPQPADRKADEATATETRFFANGGFYTPDRRARFVQTRYRPPMASQAAASAVAAAEPTASTTRAGHTATPDASSSAAALLLNTGRIRDQWHTMTRTGRSARLTQHIAEPFVELNPADATRLSLEAADLAIVESTHGSAILRVVVTERVAPGTAFAPIHWTSQHASRGRVGALIPAHIDPVSGQPEFKATAVQVRRYAAPWYGFAVGATKPNAPSSGYWALARSSSGWQIEIAGDGPRLHHTASPDTNAPPTPLPQRGEGTEVGGPAAHEADLEGVALLSQLWPELLATDATACTLLAYRDNTRGQQRFAVFEGDTLVAALFLARTPVACARGWLIGEIGRSFPDASDRYRILAGRPGGAVKDRGPIVCSCLGIGRNDIAEAIASGCRSVAAVGTATGAGTNCGSCRPEITRLIDQRHAAPQSPAELGTLRS